MNGWNSNNVYDMWQFVGSTTDRYRHLLLTDDEWHKVVALLYPDKSKSKSVNRRKRIAKLRRTDD